MEVRDLAPHGLGGGLVEHFLLVLIKAGVEQWITQVRSLLKGLEKSSSVGEWRAVLCIHLTVCKPDRLIKTMSAYVQRRSLTNVAVAFDCFHDGQGDCP